MEIVFLGASVPLTKTLVFHEGQFSTTPYPRVTKVTSYHEQASSLAALHALLLKHAAEGHCLFNGRLLRPLDRESREGQTVKGEKRDWVVFDFDKVKGDSASDVIARYLPPECQNVGYISQPSSSMYRPDRDGLWSGHIFMWLSKPVDEATLKNWTIWINFANADLKGQLSLTDSGTALHWPLDRTAAYNSKLIYIAPPTCIGFETTASDVGIILHEGPKLTIPAFTPVSSDEIHDEIKRLRKRAQLPDREFKTVPFEDSEILLKADRGIVHDVRPVGDHYIRFNLNGGDSLAYWMDLRNPQIIKNFKGEPYYYTKEVDPDFYKGLVKQASKVVSKPGLDDGVEVLAFYATNQAGMVKTGVFNAAKRELRLDDSNLGAAAAWMAHHGVTIKGHLPHYDIVFDPRSKHPQHVPGYPVINTFRATNYMTIQPTGQRSTVAQIPPTIRKTMASMLGDPDLIERFTNWIAYILQKREKTTTAWVLHGEEGTGKSVFIDKVLRPIFGSSVVRNVQYSAMDGQFNGFLENALFIVVEEANMAAADNNSQLMEKLKHWTTDSPIEIRDLHKSGTPKPNYSNFIFNSNERNPIKISNSNRRFIVAKRQNERLVYTPNEWLIMSDGSELEQFAQVLLDWEVNDRMVREVYQTEDSKLIHEQTTSINQLIAENILAGNLDYFIERIPSDAEAQSDFYNKVNMLPMYKTFLAEAASGLKNVMSEQDLFTVFRTLIPDERYFQNSNMWRKKHYHALGLIAGSHYDRKTKKSMRGVKVEWKHTLALPSAPEVTPIKVVK